jgi:hypothetical protein
VIARQSVWSNPNVVRIAKNFVAVGDEVDHLQRSRDPEGQLFNRVAEQGHYAGRTQPTDTRQGTYALTPSGVFLASINTNSADEMAAMLTKALRKWRTLSKDERLMDRDPSELTPQVKRPESKYPVGGLVLREYSRDLARSNPPTDWRADAWNSDYVWFRKEEVRQMVPDRLRVGAECKIPDSIARRWAAGHLIDNVRGQVPAFQLNEVERADITSRVVDKQGGNWIILFEGRTSAVANGSWSIAGYRDINNPSKQSRGVRTKMTGLATYNPSSSRFVKFELSAVGTRFGATQYNGRADDVKEAPIGFYFTLAGTSAEEQMPPAGFWLYGW